jgi:hypothetical protein
VEIFGRIARAIVHRRTRSRCGGRVDIGGAQVHVDLVDDFGIELLVRIDRIAAGVVQRDTIDGLRDAGVVEAANIEHAARRTERIVVLKLTPGTRLMMSLIDWPGAWCAMIV